MIRLEHISRDFAVGNQTVRALKNISVAIAPGEYLSVMGPSGSGKSTLLNLLALLDRPSAGRYLLNGCDVSLMDELQLTQARRDNFGFVFQSFHLIPRLTAAENVEIPLMLAGVDPKERQIRVADALDRVGLSPRAEHRPDQLSGGQRQRVAIARATIMRPGTILADEPTGNLDSSAGHEIIKLLEQLNSQGATLIIITHDTDIGARAPRRIRLVDGAVAADEG